MVYTAEIKTVDGSVGLYINGEKTAPVLYALSDIPASKSNTAQAQRNIANFARAGVNLVQVDTKLGLGWHKSTSVEFDGIQAEIAGALDANPDAGIMIRLHMNPPYWWIRDNPDECALHDGVLGCDDGEQDRLIRGDNENSLRASIASEKWLDEVSDLLAKLCQYLQGTEEGDHVIAIQVAYGMFGEWHQWVNDTSAPMCRRFRRYLKEKYGTVEALRAAWNCSDIDFETAEMKPDWKSPSSLGDYRDPVDSMQIIDSQYTIQLTTVEAISRFCRVIKENWRRPVLAGTFYGYYVCVAEQNAPVRGHLLPEMMFADENVDFLSGPFPYEDNRKLVVGAPMSRGVLESCRLRGKLWFTEMDQRPEGIDYFPHGDPEKLDETIFQLRKCAFHPIYGGQGFWYYDHRVIPKLLESENVTNPMAGSIYRKVGWWDTPELMDEIERMQTVMRKYAEKPYSALADVLIVHNPKGRFYQKNFVEDEYQLHSSISFAGAAYDEIYLPDLDLAEMDRYKCVIFTNCVLLTEADREMVVRRCEGKTVLFTGAAGYTDGKSASLANIEALTGMKVGVLDVGERVAHSVWEKCEGTVVENKTMEISPQLYIESGYDTELLRYAESGKVACARRGKLFFTAFQRTSTDFMREILRAAGAHLWRLSGDSVQAGCGLVALNCYEGGDRELTLKNGKKIKITLPRCTSAIFDSESGERVL